MSKQDNNCFGALNVTNYNIKKVHEYLKVYNFYDINFRMFFLHIIGKYISQKNWPLHGIYDTCMHLLIE